jgi:hypothetical protein
MQNKKQLRCLTHVIRKGVQSIPAHFQTFCTTFSASEKFHGTAATATATATAAAQFVT